jgi:uncharacterized lipoprotein YddW (UPF0748 family)
MHSLPALWLSIAFCALAPSCKPIARTESTAPSAPTPPADPAPAIPAPAAVIPPRDSEHAMWVTRWDYKTPADLTRIAERCREAGIDTILFQVRGNATAYYRSTIEPWAEQFDFKDPGFDPLALMIEAAHGRGMRLVAWVNVVPAWYGPVAPKSPAHVWNKHPEWSWYDQKGKRQAFSEKFYVSLNPCLPEVRAYIVSVIEEIVANYAIDGLHLDYMRFPNESPATPAGSGVDYPRDSKTLAIFEKATGKKPDADRVAWDSWRTAQVTQLVRQIRAMVNARKPAVELTSAVGPIRANALTHFQDSDRWLAEDLVDGLYPMNYAADPKVFAQRCAAWKSAPKDKRIVMGVMFEKAKSDALRAEVQQALDEFNGFAVFAWGSLFETPNDAVDRPEPAARAARDALRQVVMPWLREARPGGAR